MIDRFSPTRDVTNPSMTRPSFIPSENLQEISSRYSSSSTAYARLILIYPVANGSPL